MPVGCLRNATAPRPRRAHSAGPGQPAGQTTTIGRGSTEKPPGCVNPGGFVSLALDLPDRANSRPLPSIRDTVRAGVVEVVVQEQEQIINLRPPRPVPVRPSVPREPERQEDEQVVDRDGPIAGQVQLTRRDAVQRFARGHRCRRNRCRRNRIRLRVRRRIGGIRRTEPGETGFGVVGGTTGPEEVLPQTRRSRSVRRGVPSRAHLDSSPRPRSALPPTSPPRPLVIPLDQRRQAPAAAISPTRCPE